MNKSCPFCGEQSGEQNHTEECYFHLLGLRGISQLELDEAWNKRVQNKSHNALNNYQTNDACLFLGM